MSVSEFTISHRLAVKYLFLANSGILDNAKLQLEPYNASHERNDYEVSTLAMSLGVLLKRLRFHGLFEILLLMNASLSFSLMKFVNYETLSMTGTPKLPFYGISNANCNPLLDFLIHSVIIVYHNLSVCSRYSRPYLAFSKSRFHA